MDLLTFQNVFQCDVEERSFCFTSWEIEIPKMGNEGSTALWPFRPLSPVCLIVTVRWSSSPLPPLFLVSSLFFPVSLLSFSFFPFLLLGGF